MVIKNKVNAISGLSFPAIALNDKPLVNHCRPSVDVLFRSIAKHFKGNVLSLIMTGMGNDGCKGVKALKRRGNYCLTQSKDTCIVYGMPMAVDEAGLSDRSIPLERLAEAVVEIIKNPETIHP